MKSINEYIEESFQKSETGLIVIEYIKHNQPIRVIEIDRDNIQKGIDKELLKEKESGVRYFKIDEGSYGTPCLVVYCQ